MPPSPLPIHQPHDGFFKHSLPDISVAQDFLKAHLSPAITQRISWNTLSFTNRSFTDGQLNDLHSDVLYTCQLDKKNAYIYLLIEQQTNPDPLLPFRFLQYNVEILKQHIKQRKKEKEKKLPLPVIINLCLYSGKKTPYPYSVDIYDCFEDPVLARAEMFKPLPLIDLGQMREDELKQHGTAALMELLLKQARYRTFLKWIKEHADEVRQLLESHYGISGIYYILGVEKKHSPEEVLDIIKAIAPNKEKNIMTALQQLKQEGIQQGMQQEKLHIAKNMLSEGFALNLIRKVSGLSEEELIGLAKEYETRKKT